MTNEDYNSKLTVINMEHDRKIKELKDKFASENAQFKVGDFIGNVTGIIKVDKIDTIGGTKRPPTIIYKGMTYKRRGGLLHRTNSNRIREMYESDSLKKVPIEKPQPK